MTLTSFKERLEANRTESRSVITKLASAKEVTSQLRDKVTEVLSALEPLTEEARIVIGQLSSYLEELGALKGMGQVLQDRVDGLRRQMDDMYETIALGLTAEALSHEVFNVADQLAKRTKTTQSAVRSKGIKDRTILTFIEHVHSAVMALRKQVSFLSPALRYVRERKDNIYMTDFLTELAQFYFSRLNKDGISISIQTLPNEDFTIRMNRGKLMQIIDNFVLNSEYWLKEDIAQKRQIGGSIIFELKRPFLRVFDNGRGIDPTVEHVLFEPFTSAKARGMGRGLGLFIIKQLLDSEGCSVGILPERNQHQRLYRFQIDFRGAINE